MGNPVVHFEFEGTDASTLHKFYSELFGWHAQWMDEMSYASVETHAGEGVNGGIATAPTGTAPFVTFYVEVADPHAALEKAVSLGGAVAKDVETIPGVVTLAQFTDIEGNRIGLVKADPSAATPGAAAGTNPGVTWFEIMGKDGPKLRAFYAAMFGWAFEEAPGMDYGMTSKEDSGIGGGIGTHPMGESYATVYAHVPSVPDALERAVELGATMVMPPMKVTDTTEVAQFSDPQGCVVGLFNGM